MQKLGHKQNKFTKLWLNQKGSKGNAVDQQSSKQTYLAMKLLPPITYYEC